MSEILFMVVCKDNGLFTARHLSEGRGPEPRSERLKKLDSGFRRNDAVRKVKSDIFFSGPNHAKLRDMVGQSLPCRHLDLNLTCTIKESGKRR
jgi:hypothetical protein